MRTKTTTTRIAGLADFGYENDSYPITVQEFESVTEGLAAIGKCSEADIAVEAPEGALAAVLGVINAAQEQGGKQGGKETIRAAMTGDLEEGADRQETVDEAISSHQTRCAKYVIGAPRGAQGGVTKTKASNVGKALLAKLGPEALEALAAEHGLDMDDLS